MHPLKLWLRSNSVQGFQAARRLNVTDVTVSRWFSFMRRMSEEQMLRVAEFTAGQVTPVMIFEWQLARVAARMAAEQRMAS